MDEEKSLPITGGVRQVEPELDIHVDRGFGDTFSAALRLENTIFSGAEAFGARGDRIDARRERGEFGILNTEADPNFDIFSTIQDTEYAAHSRSFIGVQNAAEARVVKNKIDKELADKELLSSMGAEGFVAGLLAAVVDPINLVPIGGTAVRGGRAGSTILQNTGRTAVAGAAGAAVAELALNPTQETRTAEETQMNILAGAVLGGIFGGSVSAFVEVKGRSGSTSDLGSRVFNSFATEKHDLPNGNSSVGAAQVQTTTLEQESLTGSLGVGKALSFQSPMTRTLHSGIADLQRDVMSLIETPFKFNKNEEGITSTDSRGPVETQVTLARAAAVEVEEQINDIFIEMSQGRARKFGDIAASNLKSRLPGNNEAPSLQDFKNSVSEAFDIPGDHPDPHITKAVNAYSNMFEKIGRQAEELGLIPEGTVGTATQNGGRYFPIDYQAEAIIARRPEWEKILADDFEAKAGNAANELNLASEDLLKLKQQRAEVEASLPDNRMLDLVRNGGGGIELTLPKRPIIDILKDRGGVDPDSVLAGELRHAGVTSRTAPGLFKKGGRKSMDDIVVEEFDVLRDNIQNIENSFADPNELIDFIRREVGFDPVRTAEQLQQLSDEVGAAESLGRFLDEHNIDFHVLSNDRIRQRLLTLDEVDLQDIQRFQRDDPGPSQSDFVSSQVSLAKPAADDSFGIHSAEDGFSVRYIMKDGRNLAAVVFKETDRGIEVDNIFASEGVPNETAFNTLGPSVIRGALRAFKQEFPNAKTIFGDRVGGARFGGQHTGNRSVGKPAEVRLPEGRGGQLDPNARTLEELEAEFKEMDRSGVTTRPRFGKVEADRLERLEAKVETLRKLSEANDPVLARELAKEVTDTILGASRTQLPDSVLSGPRGPLKERTLSVDPRKTRDFRNTDITDVGRKYARTTMVDMELVRKFGHTDMRRQLEKYDDAFELKRAKALTGHAAKVLNDGKLDHLSDADKATIRSGSLLNIQQIIDDDFRKLVTESPTVTKELRKLDKQHKQVQNDVATMLKRVRGEMVTPRDPHSIWMKGQRAALAGNYLRLLGFQTVSAIPDLAIPIFKYGFRPFTAGWGQMIGNFKNFNFARKELRGMGVGIEMAWDSRLESLSETFVGEGGSSKFEKAVDGTSRVYGIATLMTPWNALNKQIVGATVSDFIHDAVGRSAAGKLKKAHVAELARMNISPEMSGRIHAMLQEHAPEFKKNRTYNLDQWQDRAAADNIRQAIPAETDRIILTPKNSKPTWMSTPQGQLVGQFKSFGFDAAQSIMVAGLQKRDAETLMGMVMMMSLGAMVYQIKESAAGRATPSFEEDPGKWFTEAFDRSGMTGWLMDVNNVTEKVTRGKVGLSALTNSGPASRYASRNVLGAILGPSAGLVDDFSSVTGSAFQGDWTDKDTARARRLIPFQNALGIRRIFDEFEEGLNKALGVDN